MNRRRITATSLLALALLAGLAVVSRYPLGRAVLYDGMSDACSDDSLLRARIWLILGASPDGASDYEAAAGHRGSEFASHVDRAVTHPDCRLLRYLLSRGASPNLEQPLSTAVNGHRVEGTKILLAAGANPRYSDQWTAVDQARSLKFNDLITIIQPYLSQK